MPITKVYKLKSADSARIQCQAAMHDCTKPATWGEHMTWNIGNTKGTSFFYHCDEHRSEVARGLKRKIKCKACSHAKHDNELCSVIIPFKMVHGKFTKDAPCGCGGELEEESEDSEE